MKYFVEVKITGYHAETVDADSEDEAVELACGNAVNAWLDYDVMSVTELANDQNS